MINTTFISLRLNKQTQNTTKKQKQKQKNETVAGAL
jgi:hypothetical protein